MTYYRIKKYLIDNGFPAGKAEYVRKLVSKLVNENRIGAAEKRAGKSA